MMKTLSKTVLTTAVSMAVYSSAIYANPQSSAETLLNIQQEIAVTNIYRAYFPSEDIADKAAISFHSQLLESHVADGYLIMELTEEEKSKLKKFDFHFTPATEFIKQRNSRLEAIENNLNNNFDSLNAQSIPGRDCFETVEETFAAAESLASSNPEIAQWIDIGDSWEKTNNYGGWDIQVLKITNSSVAGDKPKLFVNSAIHAREYATAPLNLAFARWLIEGYQTNPDATWIVDNHEVHLLLQTNPDARKKAETGLSWRKNTNRNYCGANSNSRGADLNRNFSFFWNYGNGSSGDMCSETYRGNSPASEPEIQSLQDYVRSIFPDKRGPNQNDAAPLDTQGIHIDIHSYGELILWPWGHTSGLAPNASGLQTLGRKFAYFNGYDPKQSIGLYPTDGTSDNVSYGELGVPAYTFELGNTFFESCATYENEILPDVLPALIYAAKTVRAPYVTPGGPDVTGLTINGYDTMAYVSPGDIGTLSASTTDTRFSTRRGTETTQNIAAAEYYVDVPPWQNGAVANALTPADGSFNTKTESVTGTISTQGLSDGKHTIYVRAKDTTNTWGPITAIFLNVTDDVPPPANQLENGVAKNDLSGSAKEQLFFTMNVPADAASLKFNTSSGSGDADLYVKFASKPTLDVHDCKSASSSNNESCEITNVKAGTYHIMVEAWSAISGVSLVGSYTTSDKGDTILENGIPKSGLSASQGTNTFYTLEVPEGATDIQFEMSGGTGDADMYVRFDAAPTKSNYDCRPYAQGNNESCDGDQSGGTYHVMLDAYTAYSGVSLVAKFTPPLGDAEPIDRQESIALVDYNQWSHFTETLTPGYQSLTVSMSGGTGDADLYVRHGSQSTFTQYDCRPYKNGNDETCVIDLPASGTWYFDIYGYGRTGSADITLSIAAIPVD